MSKVEFESGSKVDLEKSATDSVKLDGPDAASLKCSKSRSMYPPDGSTYCAFNG